MSVCRRQSPSRSRSRRLKVAAKELLKNNYHAADDENMNLLMVQEKKKKNKKKIIQKLMQSPDLHKWSCKNVKKIILGDVLTKFLYFIN